MCTFLMAVSKVPQPRRGGMLAQEKKAHRKGFLLIEAIVVIVILSVGLTLIIQATVAGLRAMTLAADYVEAVRLAENTLFPLLQEGRTKAPFVEENRFADNNFSYRLEAQRVSGDVGSGDLNEVELEVRWRAGRSEKKVSLQTYLLADSQ